MVLVGGGTEAGQRPQCVPGEQLMGPGASWGSSSLGRQAAGARLQRCSVGRSRDVEQAAGGWRLVQKKEIWASSASRDIASKGVCRC